MKKEELLMLINDVIKGGRYKHITVIDNPNMKKTCLDGRKDKDYCQDVKECDWIVAVVKAEKRTLEESFFSENFLIIDDVRLFYSEIHAVETYRAYYGKPFMDDYTLCYGKDDILRILSNKQVNEIAVQILFKIIRIEHKINSAEESFHYYISEIDSNKDRKYNWMLYQLAKKSFLDIENSGEFIETFAPYVAEYGLDEYYIKRREIFKRKERAIGVKTNAKGMLKVFFFQYKKAKKEIQKGLYELVQAVYEECKDDLHWGQRFHAFDAYKEYVLRIYEIAQYAALAKSWLDKKYVNEFIKVIKQFDKELEDEIIFSEDNDINDVLLVYKSIGDLYYGEITDSGKIIKINGLKNYNKAFDWYTLFLSEDESDDLSVYGEVAYRIANIYRYGTSNMKASEEKMVEYLEDSAACGYERATGMLAEYYTINGDEHEKDKWIERAKENKQKVKDKRSLKKKFAEKTGYDITESMETAVEVVGGVASMVKGTGEIVDNGLRMAERIANDKTSRKQMENQYNDAVREDKQKQLEHEQAMRGQEVSNKESEVNLQKRERKAEKKLEKLKRN